MTALLAAIGMLWGAWPGMVAGPEAGAPDWPPRWVSTQSTRRGVIREAPGRVRTWRARVEFLGIDRPSPEDLGDAAALVGENRDAWPEVTFERGGSFLWSWTLWPEGQGMRAPRGFTFISGRQGPEGVVRIERTWFVLSMPAGDVRGTVLLIPGMFGTPEGMVKATTEALRSRGWAVLQMLAHPSRFTERVTFPVSRADLAGSAQRIADELGDRTAECAYAAATALEHAVRTEPRLAGRPRVALGMSGGAMVMPTVMALDPGGWSACVLIGGGCDYLRVATESSYAGHIDSISVEWEGPEPDPHERERLQSLYLERASLDSYHTAPVLAGTRVLMLHASEDRAVPAALGDLLWERAGKPERWVERTGHEVLFLGVLPGRLQAIADWLDENAGR